MGVCVLVVEDDKDLREALCDSLTLEGFEVVGVEHGKRALAVVNSRYFNIVVSDVAMNEMDGYALLKWLKDRYPELPVLLMTAYADITHAIQAIKGGAADYLVKPFDPKTLVKKINKFMRTSEMSNECNMVAVDDKTVEVFRVAKQVAMTNVTALITGQSGTGKEVLARYIHDNSKRKTHPFVAINCAAIPENMLEATLFGYEKGAFTGAYQTTIGKFEQAQNGTLLLDEITEMDLNLQAKLLRVLQEREVERLGSRKTIKLNVRVLATSNRNLLDEVEKNNFREDLYYRLNVFPIYSPTLKERAKDILPLVNCLIDIHIENTHDKPTLTKKAQIKLEEYSWPGNVRELDNVIQRALILCKENVITEAEIKLNTETVKSKIHDALDKTLGNDIRTHEFNVILDVLNKNNGCRTKTAEMLGISVRTLRYKLAKMKALDITIPNASKS